MQRDDHSMIATDGWRLEQEVCGDARAGDSQCLISSKPQSKASKAIRLLRGTYWNGARSLVRSISRFGAMNRWDDRSRLALVRYEARQPSPDLHSSRFPQN